MPVVTSSAKGLPDACAEPELVAGEGLVDPGVSPVANSPPYGLVVTQLLR